MFNIINYLIEIINITTLDDLRTRKKSVESPKQGGHLSRKVEVEYIESARKRQQTIYKRRSTLFKKAKELGVMTGAEVALVYKVGEKTFTYFSNEEMKRKFNKNLD